MLFKESGLFSILRLLAQFFEIKATLKPRYLAQRPLLLQELLNNVKTFSKGNIVGTHI